MRKYQKPVLHDVTDSPVNIMMSASMWLPVVRVWESMREAAGAISLHADGTQRQVGDLICQHVYKLKPLIEWSQADSMCFKATENALNEAKRAMAAQDALPDMLPCLLVEPWVAEILKLACEDPDVHESTRAALLKARTLLGESAIDLLADLA